MYAACASGLKQKCLLQTWGKWNEEAYCRCRRLGELSKTRSPMDVISTVFKAERTKFMWVKSATGNDRIQYQNKTGHLMQNQWRRERSSWDHLKVVVKKFASWSTRERKFQSSTVCIWNVDKTMLLNLQSPYKSLEELVSTDDKQWRMAFKKHLFSFSRSIT